MKVVVVIQPKWTGPTAATSCGAELMAMRGRTSAT